MAYSVKESFPFVTGSGDGRTLSYKVFGDDAGDTDLGAELAVWAAAPAVYADFDKQSISSVEEASPLTGRSIWFVDVEYSNDELTNLTPPPTGSVEFSFDVSLQSVNVNYALENVASFMAPGKTAPTSNAIGVDVDGVAQGTGILAPTSTFSLSYYPLDAVITSGYKTAVEDAVGKVSSTAFGHRAAGEVMLMAAAGSKRTDEDWKLDFKFGVRANVTGLTLSGISGLAKKGWERFDPVVEAVKVSGKVQPSVIGFLVQRDYETADFASILAIPGYT